MTRFIDEDREASVVSVEAFDDGTRVAGDDVLWLCRELRNPERT